ncbi:2-dehydropantoate 2-reductase-like protein [Melanomma pulvis-pyrius CBS 109.77]|uniref:2-dehydropantoate 2-reductase n=1 Tax=Melanomma pulvis-pyrius CBS 109.77 TaxID=1314802 RepID=A0A6A6XE57_9PLEO|nr:2-dehydropantoate 2-reductase-like protein [Melanomma pulvis-pyrius CBS 109.77]
MSIHILGIGNLGKLLAHSLRKSHPEIPITLLFHRPGLAEDWERAGRCIEIVRNGQPDRQGGFLWGDVWKERGQIQNLILATKTYSTVQALRPLKDRLGSESTVLFLQNGIGTIDEVTSQVFPQTSSRPNYLAGIINHGIYTTSQFSSVHAGIANAVIGPLLSQFQSMPSTTSPESPTTFLAQKIVNCPILSTSFVSKQEFLHAQLQKLVINAVINPLTVIFDCFNGELFHSARICTLIDRIIAEVSVIIIAILSTTSQEQQTVGSPLLARFDPESLRTTVHAVGAKTAKNISSMRQDVLAGRRTEIDYINGWVIKTGAETGIECPVNARTVKLVKEGRGISEDEIDDVFPS